MRLSFTAIFSKYCNWPNSYEH